jgi:hypothetical protein
MKTNEASWDRIVRVIAGIVLIGLAATQTVGWWGWLGVIPLVTGAIGWCPLYAIVGKGTCPVKQVEG